MGDKYDAKARDLMDEACLGEPFVSNGVVAALKASIESALRSAAAEEREACAKIIKAKMSFENIVDEAEAFADGTDRDDEAGDMIYGLIKALKLSVDAIRSRGIPND